MLKRGNIFLFELSWIAQNFITVKAKIWHNDLQHHNISSFYITLTTNKSLHKFTWVKIQNTVFSLLWSQHMVSNINHHKGHQIMFHINISSEYCIHVYLTIVSVLLENLGDFNAKILKIPHVFYKRYSYFWTQLAYECNIVQVHIVNISITNHITIIINRQYIFFGSPQYFTNTMSSNQFALKISVLRTQSHT